MGQQKYHCYVLVRPVQPFCCKPAVASQEASKVGFNGWFHPARLLLFWNVLHMAFYIFSLSKIRHFMGDLVECIMLRNYFILQVDNFIHADMHPGNILVREANTKPSHKRIFRSKPLVILLDVGLTAELSMKDRVNLLDFFKAIALQDGHMAAECTLRLSKQQNCPNPGAFIKVMHLQHSFCMEITLTSCYRRIGGSVLVLCRF